ncbi:MAG TPA: energy transducer TonB [Vicinamibacterales bacterium]
MKKRILLTVCFLVSAAAPLVAQERDGGTGPLAAARDLYASARYDEALAVLNGLRPDDAVPDRKSVEQYRSLCLLALGRGTEAEAAIAAVVTVDPLFQPSESDASPRVRAAFSDVRQKLLPEIATSRYATAKAAYERKEYASAEQQFRALLKLLDDPQMAGRLGDLRTIASGFLDLSAAAAAPPPEPKPEPKAAAAVPPPAPVAPPKEVYSFEDPGVMPPVVVRQDLPRVPPSVTAQARDKGMLEVVIDQQGRVSSMNLRRTIHPMYDGMLLNAAQEWRYKPAMLNGQPVKFLKVILITVDKK